jgi:hypothetical protein
MNPTCVSTPIALPAQADNISTPPTTVRILTSRPGSSSPARTSGHSTSFRKRLALKHDFKAERSAKRKLMPPTRPRPTSAGATRSVLCRGRTSW